MEPEEILRQEPVLRPSEAITHRELLAIRNGYLVQWQRTPWYKPYTIFKFRVGVGVMDSLLDWLEGGK